MAGSALQIVGAGFAIYTTGYRNRWGILDPDVSRRWRQAGTCELNTALTGQLAFAADDSGRLYLRSVYKSSWAWYAAVRYRGLPVCAEP